MRRELFRIISATATLLLFLNVTSVAQGPDDYEDEDVPRTAVLTFSIQQNGTTNATFYSPVPYADMPGIREALNADLHCNFAPMQPYPLSQIKDPAQREVYRLAQERRAASELQATCRSSLQKKGMRTTLDLSFAEVLRVLRAKQFTALQVSLFYAGLNNLHVAQRQPTTAYAGMLTFQLPIEDDEGKIHLEWGYQRTDLLSPILTAGLFIIVPCALILWMRSRALHLHTTDRAGAWFSYIRTQNLCTSAALLIWIGGGFSMRSLLTNLLTSAFGPHHVRAAILSVAYFILPPLTVLLVSALASYRVMVEVRQVPWRFRDFFGLQIAQLGMVLIPVLGVYSGFQLMADFPWLAWGTIILAFLAFPFAIYLRRKLTGRYPEPVTSGEFHDRIFLLARRAGVALKGIFLLPSGKLPVANAFAAGNGIVMVTDYILQKLNRREVEAIAAHEIGHLQYKHPRKLGLAILAVILVPIFVRTIFPTMFYTTLAFTPSRSGVGFWGVGDGLAYPTIDFAVAILCLLFFYAMSRRFERIADERSVSLTDDPEALITAFAKLSLINLTPLQWGRGSEALVTHPSTLKRIHRIARAGNVSEERVQALLANPSAHDEPHVPVPTFESPRPASEFVYPPREQAQRAQVNLLLLIAISTGVPTLFAYIAGKWSPYFQQQWPILLAGIVVTFGAYLGAFRSRVVSARPILRKRFESHVRQLHPSLDLSRSYLVGYSPDPWPRFYYVQSHWDMGLLIPASEGLLYLGDQSQFLLPYESIAECVFAEGTPGWWKLRRTYILWSHQGQRGTLNFIAVDPCSPLKIDFCNQQLHDAILRSRTDAAALHPLPDECASLTLPDAIVLKTKTPHAAYPFQSVVKLAMFAAIPGALLTNAFLPTGNFTFLLPMFYVPGTVFLLRFLEWIPYARYKDRPLSPEWTSSKVVENRSATWPNA